MEENAMGSGTPSTPPTDVIQSAAALEVLSRAEVDIQIATAKKFPMHGNVHQFSTRAKALVLLDRESADRCTYTLPRGKGEAAKFIRGPSTFFAHNLAVAWGNIRVQSRIVGSDETGVVAQGTAMDLESNYAISAEVRKSIVGRDGRRYSSDMVTMTSMAASSIARRNAILSVIPRAYWEPLWKEAQTFSQKTDKRTLSEQRAAAVQYFEKRGVSQKRLLETLEKKGIEDLDPDDIENLRGIKTALDEGETTLDEAFPLPSTVRRSSEMPSLTEVLEKQKKGGEMNGRREAPRDERPREPGIDSPA